jgi:hypothetical protein
MQSTKRSGRLAIAGAAGIAAITLVAGCGSSSTSGSAGFFPSTGSSSAGNGSPAAGPHTLLAASVEKTEAAKNAQLHIDVQSSSGAQSVDISGDGIIDFAHKRFQLALALPSSLGIGGTIEERVIDGVFYLHLPAIAEAATGGKAWIKVDASQLDSGDAGFSPVGQDPTQYLGMLRSVSDSVTKLGTVEIRGVETTHYRAQVDLAKAAAAGGADTASIDQFKTEFGTTTIPEDVYIDAKGMARRFSVSFTPPADASGAAASVSFSTTVDLFNFGTTDTSDIVAPPADEISSLPSGINLGG